MLHLYAKIFTRCDKRVIEDDSVRLNSRPGNKAKKTREAACASRVLLVTRQWRVSEPAPAGRLAGYHLQFDFLNLEDQLLQLEDPLSE